MQQQKKNLKSPNPISLQELIQKHQDLALYFSMNCPDNNYEDLTVRLLREAIATRMPKEKHYNVAYVKHNRFLSPSQKQAVTPKVTQIIPLSPQPQKIYGKPKVKLNEQYISTTQQLAQTYQQTEAELPHSKTSLKETSPQKDSNTQTEQQIKQPEVESEKYLSPLGSKQLKMQSRELKISQNTEAKKKSPEQQQQPFKQTNKNGNKQNSKVQPPLKATLKQSKSDKQLPLSPQHPTQCSKVQKYQKVQSRIKFLIDRDKKSKQLQNQLEEQNKKINQLEERQQKLLIKQYEQLKELNHQQKTNQLACCGCSSDEDINNQLLEMKLRSEQQKYNKSNSASYLGSLSNIKKQLSPSKIYKINSNPVYPISSSDSEASSEDIPLRIY